MTDDDEGAGNEDMRLEQGARIHTASTLTSTGT
jgi:hypothetical protein